MHIPEADDSLTLTRRRFVQGIAAAGLAALVEAKFSQANAETIAHSPSVLTGNHFDLAIEPHHVDFIRRRVKAIKINGSLPGPTLKWREGETVTIAVTNHLPDATSIHWHGMRIPAEMDGVPGLSYAGIAPGKTFVYRFPVLQNGTYWYHSHSGSRMGRNRRAGTCSVLLQFCANAVCPRWRTRRGKNLRLVRSVPHSTPDPATSSRIEFLQSGRSWAGDWNGTVRSR